MQDKFPRERKHVYRLKNTRSLVAETLAMLDKIAADESQSPAKRSSAVFARCSLVETLLASESSEKRARLKFTESEDEPPSGKDEPKIPIVPNETAAVRAFKESISKL